jgi:hypothetical protein
VRSVGRPQAWDPEVIDQAIPELPKVVPNNNGRGSPAEPPVELVPGALEVFRGEKPKAKDTGEIDRSGSLVKIGRVLYDAGATRSAIVAALAERDEALGWHKYTERHDAEQRYHEIVDELESNGRNVRARISFGKNGRSSEDGELPKIVVNNRHLREVTSEALSALATRNDPPELFVRAGRLVRVREDENGIPEIQVLEDSHVKGRLARVADFNSGHTAEMLGAPRDEEEWRKQITAKLAAGATMITVDNVEGALYAPSLARALTARTWTDRVLGRSETITVGQRATWIATGNNIQLRGDLPRRCYWIRLDARESRPWQRQNFKHPDLLGWVAKNRGRLIHALLTLARAWFAAGKPKTKDLPRLGSFESWAETVGGMVAFAGIPDFLGNLEELYDKADAGGAEWEGFLYTWWEELDASKPITVADLTKHIDNNDTLKEALPGDLAEAFDKSTGSFSRKLGTALAKRAGTRYGEDGMHIVRAGEFRRAVRWKLDIGAKECEFVSLVSLINPSAGKIPDEKNIEGAEKDSTNSQTHSKGGERP